MENGVSYPFSWKFSARLENKAAWKHFPAQFGHFISNDLKLIRNLSDELKQINLKRKCMCMHVTILCIHRTLSKLKGKA